MPASLYAEIILHGHSPLPDLAWLASRLVGGVNSMHHSMRDKTALLPLATSIFHSVVK
jgi:hypothetical protein